jgi:hypothetical protein
MKYCVNVPLEKRLQFPNTCPFSGAPSPNSHVRLKRSSTSLVLALPGGFYNSYSTTSLRIPSCRQIAALAVGLEAMIWLSLLGGIAMCVWLLSVESTGPRAAAALFLIGAPVAAAAFRLARYLVLRKVRLNSTWNGFAEVQFRSEAYAKEFCELNRLPLDAR